MRVLFLTILFSYISASAMAGCENSTLVIRANSGTPIKVYIDGETGSNPATAAVTVRELTPGSHTLKVVAVYRDDSGRRQRDIIYGGTIDVQGYMYMDAHVEEHKGVSIHQTRQACGDQPTDGVDQYQSNNADNANNNTTNNNSQPSYAAPIDNNASSTPAPTYNNNTTSSTPTYNSTSAPTSTNNNSSPTFTPAASDNASQADNSTLAAATPKVTFNDAGLPTHMSAADFDHLKNTISNTQYDIKKMDTLNAITKGKRFACSQVAQLMNLFSFESDKLTVAKTLYPRTVDKGSYSRLAAYFNFDNSKEDFKKFLAGK